jgi:hypothetical protein
MQAIKRTSENNKAQLEEKKKAMEELSDRLDDQIKALEAEKLKITDDLKNAEREKLALDEKVKNLATAALKFEETVGGMEQSLKSTRAELDQARADNIKLSKNLDEVTASLNEKIAQLEALQTEKMRLLEEKTALEEKLAGGGKSLAAKGEIQPVTPMQDFAMPAAAPSQEIPIQGLVTGVESGLATLSIGSADGVQKGMIFHVVRSDRFICDIQITEVDTEVSAGSLQLVQEQPNVGDTASTTW